MYIRNTIVCVILLLTVKAYSQIPQADSESLETVTASAAVDSGDITIADLAASMCTYLEIANGSGRQDESGVRTEDKLLEFNNWTRETENYQQKVAEFWNANSSQIMCVDHHVYRDQHFVMRVIDMQMYTPILIEWMLKDETLYPFDFNAVQDLPENPITLLDFIDGIINDPTVHPGYEMSEIRELREILITFYDAKHAHELAF